MKKLFAEIAHGYDTMNRIMSLGLDCLWRRLAIRRITLSSGAEILDLACGTGDFTRELARRWPDAEITGVDLTEEMLEIADGKLADMKNVTLLKGDAQNLSAIGCGKHALVVCAFGFRNFPDKAKTLSECRRVLAPGGRLVVLELFRPKSKILGAAVNAWLAVVSRLFASDAGREYRYLRRSVMTTVSADEFIGLAEENGFSLEANSFFPPAASSMTFVAR